jgi:hypothetical protein
MTGWDQVWECPRCGQQMAMGGEAGTVVQATSPWTCAMGHPEVEMEQRLSSAIEVQPEDLP